MQNQKKKQYKLKENKQQIISYCPICSTSFYPDEVSVVAESQQTKLLHTTCTKCASAIVILLVVHNQGINSIGLATDLKKEEEVSRFKDGRFVSSDDVISLHSAVRGSRFLDLL